MMKLSCPGLSLALLAAAFLGSVAGARTLVDRTLGTNLGIGVDARGLATADVDYGEGGFVDVSIANRVTAVGNPDPATAPLVITPQ